MLMTVQHRTSITECLGQHGHFPKVIPTQYELHRANLPDQETGHPNSMHLYSLLFVLHHLHNAVLKQSRRDKEVGDR